MSCPTCDHTMSQIGMDYGDSVYWCPRCGSIKGKGFADAPKLVERCRNYGQDANNIIWCALGIEEAINLPKDRPSHD